MANTGTRLTVRDVDRIDFLQRDDGRIVVEMFRRGPGTDPSQPSGDTLVKSAVEASDFDLNGALAWCRKNCYAVYTWRGGARAWRWYLWPVRSVRDAARMRRKLKEELERQPDPDRRAEITSLLDQDLVYCG